MFNDTGKYWATNRGWISNKFAVKNTPSHFLNAYKKKPQVNKTTTTNDNQKISLQKDPNHTKNSIQNKEKLLSPFQKTQSRLLNQDSIKKPKSAPLNWSLIEPSILDKQGQQNPRVTKTKRNKSLHIKKAKHINDSTVQLRQVSDQMQKLKNQNEKQSLSQRNFKATNYGRYKPQLMFLKPQMRNNSLTVKMDKVNAYEILEQKKTSIYREIHKSMYVDEKIDCFDRQKRAASIGNYQPIEYMTEYGQSTEQQIQNEEQKTKRQFEKSMTGSFRRKQNMAILKNKLHYQFKQSGYKQKIANISIEPQICLISHQKQ